MKKKHLQPLTPAALYARVSSDRQDVDLSVSAQLRALKEYAKANGYSVAREYVDEAESGRVADRPQFREMIEEGSKPKAAFEVILVWKFSRFTRKREHAVAFKSQLRRKGIRVVSITEQAEDNATGRLLEGIIESVDEYYSENLAQVSRAERNQAVWCCCSAIPSSLTVKRKCPHHGECDIDAERADEASGSQQFDGEPYDLRAGSDIDGSERAPHQAYSGGLQKGWRSRTRSRQSRSQTGQRYIGPVGDRRGGLGADPIRGSQPHSPERVAEGARGHRHRS